MVISTIPKMEDYIKCLFEIIQCEQSKLDSITKKAYHYFKDFTWEKVSELFYQKVLCSNS